LNNLSIPKQLRHKHFRFIKIKKNTKKPIEKNWSRDNNYRYNEQEFVKYLKNAQSYGVACGYGDLTVIDCDTEELHQLINQNFPETFTVKTNRGYHHYFFVSKYEESKVLDLYGTHLGEIISMKKQVIGPNSLHKSGKQYTIINDIPIKEVYISELKDKLSIFFPLKHSTYDECDEDEGFDLSKLVDLSKLTKKEPNVYQGPHPVHSSGSKNNFRIDLNKNVWFCFRHWTGGGPLSFIAVLEGIIDCKDAKKGALKGKTGRDTIKIAIDKYGLKKKYVVSEKKHILRAIKKLKDTETVTQKGYITIKQICKDIGLSINRSNTIRLGIIINKELKIPTTRKHIGFVIELNSKNRKRLYHLFSTYRIFL